MTCCNETTSQDSADRTLRLDFLFLDETVCKPCGATGTALDEAAALVAGPLAAMGLALDIRRIHVATRDDAVAHRLITSPTIRINGDDIDPAQAQGACGSCGALAGGTTTVDCRTWTWRGDVYPSAPTGMIVDAILTAAVVGRRAASACCAPTRVEPEYTLPENLDGFFQARERGEPRCC